MFKIARKDIKLFFTDRRGLLMAFAVPIALITLFAFAFGGAGGSNSGPRTTTLVIADQDNTVSSKMLIDSLDALQEFVVLTTTGDSAEMMVMKGDEAAVLFIAKGFQDSIKSAGTPVFELKFDTGEAPRVAILQGALYGRLNQFVGMQKAYRMIVPHRELAISGMLDSVGNAIDTVLKGITPIVSQAKEAERNLILNQTALVQEKQNSPGLVHAVAGTAIMMLLFSVTAMGTAMLDEKAEGTLKKLLFSPINPSSILFGKMISVNIISIMQLSVMFIFGWLVFGLDITHNIPSLLLMIVCTAYACSSFGVFLVSFAKSRAQVQGMSTLVIMTMSALGGSMVPSFIMPAFMQKLGVITVNYWGVQGFYDIFWRDLPISDPTFLTRALVLVCIGTGLNFIAVRLFKRNVLALV